MYVYLFVPVNNHTTCNNRNDNGTGQTRLTALTAALK